MNIGLIKAQAYLTHLAIEVFGDAVVVIDFEDIGHGASPVVFSVFVMHETGPGIEFYSQRGEMIGPIEQARDWLRAERLIRQCDVLMDWIDVGE